MSTLAKSLSVLVSARLWCLTEAQKREIHTGNPLAGTELRERALGHFSAIAALVNEHMPRGAGIDCTRINLDRSTPEKLVFETSFQHMNEHGVYDGWTEHKVTARASLQFGITLQISGRDRNQIKDYLHDVFESSLTQEIRNGV